MQTGRRVMMGAPGAPELSVSEAVQASCAIPGVFRPVHVGGHTYVDGGVWSPTNMDAADVLRNDRVLCLNPTGSLRPTLSQPLGALGLLSRSRAAAETLALTARGARVSTINPDEDSTAAMGTDLMDPSRRDDVVGAGLAQGRRLAQGRTLTRER
jgi:NTE family protein